LDHATPAISIGGTNISHTIDDRPLSRLQLRVLVICALVILLDGFDVQIITYIAPSLSDFLHLQRGMLGPVFSAGLVGTVLGALLIAPLSDRLGRKSVLAACVLIFGLCSLGTVTSTSVESLMVWRLVGGLGLGGATPIATALGAEYAPRRIRGTAVMIIYCGFAVGAAGGGLLAAALLKSFGWQSVFLIGGILPLALFVGIVLLLPESISFLAMKGKRPDLIARYVSQIDPAVQVNPRGDIVVDEPAKGFPVGHLFTHGRAARTLLLWLMFFANITSLYFMVSWFPTLANAAGIELNKAVLASAVIQVGSIVGTLSLAGFAKRFNAFTILGVGFAGGTLALLLMSVAGSSFAYLACTAFLGGFFVIGTQTGANGTSSIVYPSSVRATGVGWALGVGRLGAVLGPFLGGLMVTHQWPTQHLYMAAAVPAAVAAVCALALSRMLRRETD
jgi:AAHS family 4-hydroxybenzoate transporter-like MFS transporter